MNSVGNIFAACALFGWIPLILGMFAFMPVRRAVIYGFLIAWLFLPMSHIRIPGFTDYNKMSAACVGVLLGSAIFDSKTLFSFRFKLIDLPMLIWCICPFFSSVYNGLGVYDGLSSIAIQTTDWGLPYFIGRVYFNDLPGLRELATGIVVGGLVYIPFCLYEIRMSPQLHAKIYGFMQHSFDETIRWGGYRPMVFMQHGLAVGMWMAAATLCAYWLWRNGALRRQLEWMMIGAFCVTCAGALANLSLVAVAILAAGGLISALDDRARVPSFLGFIALLATLWMCHATGAVMLLILGFGALFLTQAVKNPVFIVALILIAPIYIILRASHLWSGQDLVRVTTVIDAGRAQSVESRLDSEDLLSDYAMRSPLFGWGKWDRSRPHDDPGHMGIPDALWIIAIGQSGLVGLMSLTAAILLPIVVLLRRIPARYWATTAAAPAAVLAVLLGLHMIDNLFNAMVNPIFILAAGGLCGLAPILAATPSGLFVRDGNTGVAAPAASGARPAW